MKYKYIYSFRKTTIWKALVGFSPRGKVKWGCHSPGGVCISRSWKAWHFLGRVFLSPTNTTCLPSRSLELKRVLYSYPFPLRQTPPPQPMLVTRSRTSVIAVLQWFLGCYLLLLVSHTPAGRALASEPLLSLLPRLGLSPPATTI